MQQFQHRVVASGSGNSLIAMLSGLNGSTLADLVSVAWRARPGLGASSGSGDGGRLVLDIDSTVIPGGPIGMNGSGAGTFTSANAGPSPPLLSVIER